ncbi:MAG TPA: thiamine pyrophosphate-binding protein [Dehalococcoidia bacterium]|nr:thiamine pyrophosphate-binding protein [Dehalococcoidia bacterium]
MSSSTGGQLLVEALVDAGVTHVVGMSGHTTLPVLDALYEHPSIRFVLAKHEQTIGGMADGYARSSGRPGVCLVHLGPSAANLLINIGAAYREYSPVIALTCNEQLQLQDRDVFNSWDQLSPFREVTKWAARPYRAADIPRIVRSAVVRSTLGRPGPVQIDLPLDVLRQDAELAEGKRPAYSSYSARSRPDPELLEAVPQMLSRAQRPVLLAGDGLVWAEGGPELQWLAERLACPVLVTLEARGLIPEDSPYYGGAIGTWGDAAGNETLRSADLVLAVGSRLADTDTLGWSLIPEGAAIVQVDVEPGLLAHQYPVDIGLACDPRRFLQDLLAILPAGGSLAERDRWRSELRDKLEQERTGYLASAKDGSPVQHQRLIKELSEHINADAVVTAGAGRHSFHAGKLLARRPRSYLKSGGFGMMGFAFPAALGAKLAHPDRDVWCLVGDGDFSMTIQDVETAVRENLNVITVVFNDSGYSSVKQIQRTQYGERPIGVDFSRTDFARFAEVFGAFGVSVKRSEEIGPALAAAKASGKPAIIDVAVEPL